MTHNEKDFKVWNDGYVQAMRDVLDWIDYDLKVGHSYAHVVADILMRMLLLTSPKERGQQLRELKGRRDDRRGI